MNENVQPYCRRCGHILSHFEKLHSRCEECKHDWSLPASSAGRIVSAPGMYDEPDYGVGLWFKGLEERN
jgi:hypothetical protein